MRRTLVATTDGSARSFCAFPHAARLAEACGLELQILHVIDDTVERTAFPADAHLRVARRTSAIRASIGRDLRRFGLKAHIATLVKDAGVHLHEALLDAAVNLGAVALAMDSRGQNVLRTAVAGSTALRVLAESHMPVLMTAGHAPPAARSGVYEVLACTDGSARGDAIGRSLALLLPGASIAVAVLQLASEDGGKARPIAHSTDQLARWFAPDIPLRRVWRGAWTTGRESVARTISAVAADESVDALALATRGFRLSHRVLRGSTGIAVLGQSPVPVLFAH